MMAMSKVARLDVKYFVSLGYNALKLHLESFFLLFFGKK